MQYFTPQGQPTGQMQYIQLLRPIMVPMPGQTASQSSSPPNHQPQQTPFQPIQQQLQQIQQPQQITQASPQLPAYPNYIPLNTGTPQTTSHHPVAQYNNPYNGPHPFSGFSQPPYPSYFSQNSRYKYNHSPLDLNLNTNEYMPSPSEYAYKSQKFQRA